MQTNREFIGRHPHIRDEDQPRQHRVVRHVGDLIRRHPRERAQNTPRLRLEHTHSLETDGVPSPRQFIASGLSAHESAQLLVFSPSPAIGYVEVTRTPGTLEATHHEEPSARDDLVLV